MKQTTNETQKGQLLEYLYGTFNKIDAIQALRKFGTMKLSTRLGELKRDYNLVIKSERKPGTRYLRYWVEAPKRKLA